MTSFAVDLLNDTLEMPAKFYDVITAGGGVQPVSVLLILFGTLFLAASVGVFGYVTLGAIVDLVTPEISREPPNREAR